MAKHRTRVMLFLLLAIVVGVGGLSAYRLNVSDLKESLIQEANSAFGAQHLRPTHVNQVEAGVFGDVLNAHLPELENAWKELTKDEKSKDLLYRIVDGESPLSELPPASVAATERLRPHVDALLAATHVEAADLTATDDSLMPANGGSWLGYDVTGTLAGLRIRQALAAEDSTEAMRDCLDGLAFARDAAVAGGLLGRNISLKIIQRLSPACAAAIETQRGAELSQALTQLRRIRDAVPEFELTMREEAIQMQLYEYGQLFSPTELDRLSARPRMFAKGVGWPPREESQGEMLLQRAMWRGARQIFADMIEAAKLKSSARDAAFKAIAGHADGWLAVFRPEPLNYLKFARLTDVGLLRLDLLLITAAARSQHLSTGAWPTSVDALVAAGSINSAERDRVTEAGIRFRVDEQGRLEIALPLPKLNESAPAETSVRLAAE